MAIARIKSVNNDVMQIITLISILKIFSLILSIYGSVINHQYSKSHLSKLSSISFQNDSWKTFK